MSPNGIFAGYTAKQKKQDVEQYVKLCWFLLYINVNQS